MCLKLFRRIFRKLMIPLIGRRGNPSLASVDVLFLHQSDIIKIDFLVIFSRFVVGLVSIGTYAGSNSSVFIVLS